MIDLGKDTTVRQMGRMQEKVPVIYGLPSIVNERNSNFFLLTPFVVYSGCLSKSI